MPALLICRIPVGHLAIDELKDVAKRLRRLPVVEPELPTVCGHRLPLLLTAAKLPHSALVAARKAAPLTGAATCCV